MMGTTHMAFAAALYLLLRHLGIQVDLGLPFYALLLGSIFPDIDHPRGFLSSQVALFRALSRALSRATVHRGIMHSLLMSCIWALLALAFARYAGLGASAALAFWLGYLLHLLGDSFTPSGIRWLQPFSAWRLRGPLATGSFAERALFLLLAAAAAYLYIF